jgi:DNA-binding transcriptional ArsR family regulator
VVAVVTVSPVIDPNAGRPSGRSAAVDGNEWGGESLRIELSTAQVDQVVRAASDGGSVSVLLSGLGDVRTAFAAGLEQLQDSRLSHSLLAGLLMLASFPADGSYVSIAEFARLLDMSPSTVHRYISTLAAVGLVERDPATRHYRLTDAG